MAVRTCCRVICFVLLGVGLVACTTSAMKLAPATPTTPYIGEAGQPAVNIQSDNYALVSDPSMPIVVATPNLDRSKSYSLAELINIAQMANPATGAAWRERDPPLQPPEWQRRHICRSSRQTSWPVTPSRPTQPQASIPRSSTFRVGR